MALGLPASVMRAAENRALLAAGHTAAFICLAVAIAVSIVAGIANLEAAKAAAEAATATPTPTATTTAPNAPSTTAALNGFIAAALVAAQAAALGLHVVRPRIWTAALALIVGTAAIALVVPIVAGSGVFATTNNSVLAMPMVALILIGGPGTGTASAIGWAAAGWVLGEAAAFTGTTVATSTWEFNHAAGFAFGVVVVIRSFDGLNRRFNGRSQADKDKANTDKANTDKETPDDRDNQLRADFALRASARLNDTALTQLRLIAGLGSGPLDERLRQQIRRDLETALGPDWHDFSAVDASRPTPAAEASTAESHEALAAKATATATATEPQTTAPETEKTPFELALPTSFAAAANAGLTVRASGDAEQMQRLTPARAAALDAAVAQCLVNVARHAGVSSAELMVGGGGDELTVAVIDTGVGFDEGDVPADRIGLRTSIRARVVQEGGAVRLWSKPGLGTTIMLTMPAAPVAKTTKNGSDGPASPRGIR